MTTNDKGSRYNSRSGVHSDLVNTNLLYHHCVIPSQQILHAVEGSFTVPNANDLIVFRHRHMELWTLHHGSGKMECIHSVPLFTDVYAAVAVATGVAVHGASSGSSTGSTSRRRMEDTTGTLLSNGSSVLDGGIAQARDGVHYLAVTSETGYVTLLRYELADPPLPTEVLVANNEREAKKMSRENGGGVGDEGNLSDEGSSLSNAVTVVMTRTLRGRFVKVSEVLLGRSGVRATVPGMRMTVGENGSALFISAFMRSKVVVPIYRSNVSDSDWRTVEEMEADELQEGSENEDDESSRRLVEESENQNLLYESEEGEGDDRRERAKWRKKRARSGIAKGVIELGSPIEVHRQTVIYSICAIEGSAETALFAALEEEVAESTEDGALTASSGSASSTGDDDPTTNDKSNTSSNKPNSGAFIKMPSSSEVGRIHSASKPARTKLLVVYAYVASLKQVQRTHLIYPPLSAHRLISLPAAPVGPGGVLVCTDEEIVWYDVSTALANPALLTHSKRNTSESGGGSTGIFRCSTPFPRRVDFPDIAYDPSIISHAITVVQKENYFLLLQDEYGDVYRVSISNMGVGAAKNAFRLAKQQTLNASKGGAVLPPPVSIKNPLTVHYYETLPCAKAMVLLRPGFLFVASDGGAQHGLFRVKEGYLSEKEYMIRRIKMVTNMRRLTGETLPPPSETEEEKERKKNLNSTTRSSGKGNALNLPPPLSSLPPPSSSKGVSPPIPPSRTIITFYPHCRLKHLDLVQSFTSTPPIVGLCCTIPINSMSDSGNRTRKGCIGGGTFAITRSNGIEDEQKSKNEHPEHQQQQVQLAAVCGRGPHSLVLQARYGYSTREIRRVDLPGVFLYIAPLASSTSLQNYYLLQLTIMQEVREASRRLRQRLFTTIGDEERHSSGSSRAHSISAMIKKALNALNIVNSQYTLGTDKIVLSTLKTTTAFSIDTGLEQDVSSGFETSERTLAVATIEGGRGYIQVTPTALNVISSPFSATSLLAALGTPSLPLHYPPPPLVEATKWAHPGGRTIIAADVSSRSAVLSFAGGGLASFHFQYPATKNGDRSLSVLGRSSPLWVLVQKDMVSTFPTVSCISLLRQPLSTVMDTASSELRTFLSLKLSSSSPHGPFLQGLEGEVSMHPSAELVAVATVATKEVQLFDPSNLRQALAIIRFPAGMDPRVDICSVLLTYMDDGMEAADGSKRTRTIRNQGGPEGDAIFSSQSFPRRVFCFVGYSDGTLVRCELDSFSAKVIDRQELSCGSKPCQLHAGDGESVCYIQSGEQCWRCAIRGGVVKVMPWRFPSRQTTFGYFSMTRRPVSLQILFEKVLKMIQQGNALKGPSGDAAEDSNDLKKANAETDEGEGDSPISLHLAPLNVTGVGSGRVSRSGSTEEFVVSLHERQLFLFSSSLMDSRSSSNSLEYSLLTKMLPLAGRRIVRHPTQPCYLLIAGTEHRFHRSPLCQPGGGLHSSSGGNDDAKRPPLPLQKRSLGKPQVYQSSLQLYHEEANLLLPPQFLSEGEAIMSIALGSFFVDMGREPIVVVGVARQFSHGVLCGSASTYKDGLLRAFRFAPNLGNSSLDPYGKPFLRLEPLHHTFVMDPGSSSNSQTSLSSLPAPDYPSALCVCEEVGLLLVGLGKENGLRLYSFGRSQFLRKRCLTNVPARITAIQVMFVKPSSGVPDQSYFVSGLYQCPVDNSEVLRCAREKQMLIVCGTEADSVFIAALQPGSRSSIMGFLMIIARDPVPRYLSCMTIINESTIAVADRFGTVAFLAIPPYIRTGFAEPIDKMTDTEIDAIIQHFAAKQQLLEEIAVHHTGSLVTTLNMQEYDPSGGEDPSLTTRIVFYGTTSGSVGCYTPFITEEDGALAAYLRPLLREHMQLLLYPGSGQLPYHYLQHHSGQGVHHVIEGQWLEAFRQSSSASVFSVRRKQQLEEKLERIRVVEAARRARLGLPPRKLPPIEELIAKQRALSTLPL